MYQAPQMGQQMGMMQMGGQMGGMGQMGMGQSPWVMYYNQQGQPYYYNEQTGEQVWQLPPGAICSRQGNAPGYNMYQQNQMWGGQMGMGQMGQQMPYGYQQTWYG